MKHDLTKCNNLRWRADNGKKGFVRYYDGKVALMLDEMTLAYDGLVNKVEHYSSLSEVEDYINDTLPGFEIVPRNPETYKDWQVGDIIKGVPGCNSMGKVEMRIGSVVYLSVMSNGQNIAYASPYLCEELYQQNVRLVLTDYEKEIAEATEKLKSECSFKEGDKVLVRNTNGRCWAIGHFLEFRPELSCPYSVMCLGDSNYYKQCIPYNEKTWQLLETTNNYKEE